MFNLIDGQFNMRRSIGKVMFYAPFLVLGWHTHDFLELIELIAILTICGIYAFIMIQFLNHEMP